LERIETALKVRSTKRKEKINIVNRTYPGALEKHLFFIGLGDSFWCIENAAGVLLQAAFCDKK